MSSQPAWRQIPSTVLALLAVFVAVQLYSMTLSPAALDDLFARYALIPVRLDPAGPFPFPTRWEGFFTLLSHAFLHGGFVHLLMNGLALLQAGPFVHQRLGAARFMALFVFSALGGAVAYVLINPASAAPMVGASGAICGVFGAYFLAVRPSPSAALADPRVRNAIVVFLGINVVLMALLPLPIAWQAHLGGFIAGALAYPVLAPRRRAGGPWG